MFTFVNKLVIVMLIRELSDIFNQHKEQALSGRYITLDMITPLVDTLKKKARCITEGYSVEKQSIYSINIGSGKIKILLWSQMHGNESTTTKALFDLLNVFTNSNAFDFILAQCTLTIVPMLNPDGAKYYTRLNANKIDLNRDAKDLSQPESKVLRHLFDTIQPNFCFNLHGQRTIFGVGGTNKSAILSFLSPAEDQNRTITKNRIVAMSVINEVNTCLQTEIPNSIGRYDDAFNINCVGDTFQNLGVPTLLYEAGHYPNDYDREKVRKLMFIAITKALQVISIGLETINPKGYFSIPNNQKTFYDIIIRQVQVNSKLNDVAIQYEEQLVNSKIEFIPRVKMIDNLTNCFGHREINGQQEEVSLPENKSLKVGNEIGFVFVNAKKIALKLK